MTTTELDRVVPTEEPTKRRAGALRRLVRKPLGLVALVVMLGLIILGLLEPVITTHPASFASLEHTNAPPGTPGWPLGGDQYGRDIWARTLTSINVSLISALIGAGVALVVGTVFGLIAGYVGKRVDSITAWLFNLLMTFPSLVLVIILSPVTGGSYQATMLIFGFFLAPGIFRLVRNLVVSVRNELYVDAARVAGLSNRRILTRHILYVIRGPIIISAAFLASAAIGVQAGLAFLGIGSTQTPSFGSMTSDAFLNIYVAPEQLVWSAGFLALLTGSLVLLGNAYRDALAAPQAKAKKTAQRPKPLGEANVEASSVVNPASAATDTAANAGGLLAIRNLWVAYPQSSGDSKAVVRGVSLEVAPGEIVGLVGESGSGKTQTAFSILGLLPPEAGVTAEVLTVAGESLAGRDAQGLRRLRGSVMSYIPQEPMSNLDPSFTIGSQLVETLRAGMSRQEARKTVLGLLERVGIAEPVRVYNSYPHQISGGMAQRVLIAGAVAPRPKLLIADEPTTALDVTVQAEILDLLRDLQGEYGMGMLLVTHNFGVVADLCDRVLVMRSGEIVESGEVRSIFHRPQHLYTQQLIGSILDEDKIREDVASASRPLLQENK
jgi:peptide/nickel transport system permease protein